MKIDRVLPGDKRRGRERERTLLVRPHVRAPREQTSHGCARIAASTSAHTQTRNLGHTQATGTLTPVNQHLCSRGTQGEREGNVVSLGWRGASGVSREVRASQSFKGSEPPLGPRPPAAPLTACCQVWRERLVPPPRPVLPCSPAARGKRDKHATTHKHSWTNAWPRDVLLLRRLSYCHPLPQPGRVLARCLQPPCHPGKRDKLAKAQHTCQHLDRSVLFSSSLCSLSVAQGGGSMGGGPKGSV